MADGKKDDDGKKGGGERSVIKDDGGKGPQAVQGREQQQQEDANTNTEMISRLEPMEAIALDIGTVVSSEGHRKWHVLSRLGSGAFGAVYLVEEEGAKKEEKYALKVCGAPLSSSSDVGRRSASIPGADGKGRNYTRKTPDLRRKRPNNRFSMGTALIAAKKTLAAIVQMHLVGFLHRDVNQASKLLDWAHGQECHLHPRLWHGAEEAKIRDMKIEALRPGKVDVKGKGPTSETAAETKTKSEAKPKAESKPKTETKTKTEAKPKSEAKPKTETKTKAEANPKSEPKTKVEPKAKAAAEGKEGSAKKAEREPKDPRRLLLGGCPKQFANILELVAPLRYYDDPPYDDIAELIATALKKMNVQTYPLDWQEGGNKA
uniref:Protein kinase domain-containing protein n=1 Tax=Meloidogyne floridensis TaxID=298350 RepID=A0A915NJB5_9BILA